MSKIEVVYAGFGEGHKQAASAAAECLGVDCLDLLDFAWPALVKNTFSSFYYILTQHFPHFWKALFTLTRYKAARAIFNLVNKLVFYEFLRHIRREIPAVIITTHFFIPNLIAQANCKNTRLITIITDLHVHPWWVDGKSDTYITALDVTKEDLLNYGVSQEKIINGFVPLRKGFLSQKDESVKEAYGKKKTGILFVSSTRGKFPFLKDILEIVGRDFRVDIIYGRNKKLKDYLENLHIPTIRFYSFYRDMWDLFSRNEIIVSKPGGLTVFEGIYKKKFFIFTCYIPGQEKANMEILIKTGVGLFAANPEDFQKALAYYQDNRQRLEEEYPIDVSDIRNCLKKAVGSLTGHRLKN